MRLSFRRGWNGAVVLVLLGGLLAACGARIQADRPGPAQVDEITVQILESFPVQVEVLIRGNLPDSCTDVDQVDQQFDPEENVFWIEITTVRTTDDACAQVLAPFEETVPLEVYGLPAGTYTVDVNGVTDTFTLSTDNVLPEETP